MSTDYAEVETEIPRRIGFCSNPVSRHIGTTEPCGTRIFDNDLEAIEIDGGYYCGPCVEHLLTLSIQTVEPARANLSKKGWGSNGRTGARLPKGEDLL